MTVFKTFRIGAGESDAGGTVVIGEDGYFSCVTDWGNYTYWWSPAQDFRSFLLSIDDSYLQTKLEHPFIMLGLKVPKRGIPMMLNFIRKFWPRLKVALAEDLKTDPEFEIGGIRGGTP